MKKWILALIFSMILLGLVACAFQPSESASALESEPSSTGTYIPGCSTAIPTIPVTTTAPNPENTAVRDSAYVPAEYVECLKLAEGETCITVFTPSITYWDGPLEGPETFLKKASWRGRDILCVVSGDQVVEEYRINPDSLEPTTDTATSQTLLQEYRTHKVLKRISRRIKVKNAYIFWEGVPPERNMIYYHTDRGDYIYIEFEYRPYFMTAQEYEEEFAPAVREWIRIGSFDHESVAIPEIQKFKVFPEDNSFWWHLGAQLLLAGGAAGVIVYKKRKKAKA